MVNSALPRMGSLISFKLFAWSWINCLDIVVIVAFDDADVEKDDGKWVVSAVLLVVTFDVENDDDIVVVSVMLGVSLLHRFPLLQWQTIPSPSIISFHVIVSFLHSFLYMIGSI